MFVVVKCGNNKTHNEKLISKRFLCFFNYFPHSCGPHGLFSFVPYKIIVTDSHCFKWWSERRFQTKCMHKHIHVIWHQRVRVMNALFAISLFDTRMNRIKIVICVNLFMRKYRNNVNYMEYVMNLCDVLWIQLYSSNKEWKSLKIPQQLPYFVLNFACLMIYARLISLFFISFAEHFSMSIKKTIRFLVFHIETRTNKEWTLLKIPTLYAHSKALILSGKSHKITMKTFPIFIRESNNHMNDLRLFFTCIIHCLKARPPIVTLECALWQANALPNQEQAGISTHIARFEWTVLNACFMRAHIGNKFAIWCALIMRS